jgi:outer membrane phospholipase A
MTVPAFGDARVMFAVLAKDDLPPEKDITNADDKKTKYTSSDSLFALYQHYLGNIAAYEPMYFLVGADPEDSKFQVSFKYRFLNPKGSIAKKYPWAKGFHFGYTQTSFWDLQSTSAPFEDTSYKPELFYLSSNIDTRALGIRRLFLQTGFQHESNGRGGEFSCTTNYLYVNPILIFYDEESRYGLQISPKVWTYVANDEDTNPDLEDYRGYFSWV